MLCMKMLDLVKRGLEIGSLPRLVLFVQLQDSTQNRQEKELGLWQNYVDSYINTSPRKL